jgi:hypothetical protein
MMHGNPSFITLALFIYFARVDTSDSILILTTFTGHRDDPVPTPPLVMALVRTLCGGSEL